VIILDYLWEVIKRYLEDMDSGDLREELSLSQELSGIIHG
jgi:hypothetical protein